MFLSNLFESDGRRVLVIYPGRFQPFHKGHAQVYQHLVKTYGGDNVFIVTSNKVELPKSPFSFEDKIKMITATGVSTSKVVQSSQPYRAMEIVQNYDPANTILLFAVSEKDMAEDPRFAFSPKKDGSPSYFQPLVSLSQCESLARHAYITTVPTFTFTVCGKPANSASQIREMFKNGDEGTRQQIVTDLYGSFDQNVYNLLVSKLADGINESNDGSTYRAQIKAYKDRDGITRYEVLNKDGVRIKGGMSKEMAQRFFQAHHGELNESRVTTKLEKQIASLEKKYQAAVDAAGLAQEKRRAKGHRQQGPSEMKWRSKMQDINTEIHRLKIELKQHAAGQVTEGNSDWEDETDPVIGSRTQWLRRPNNGKSSIKKSKQLPGETDEQFLDRRAREYKKPTPPIRLGEPGARNKDEVRKSYSDMITRVKEDDSDVSMDIPFLIRALEYAREDAKDDMDLHSAVERMMAAAKSGKPLQMADYDQVFGNKEIKESIFGKMKRGAAAVATAAAVAATPSHGVVLNPMRPIGPATASRPAPTVANPNPATYAASPLNPNSPTYVAKPKQGSSEIDTMSGAAPVVKQPKKANEGVVDDLKSLGKASAVAVGLGAAAHLGNAFDKDHTPTITVDGRPAYVLKHSDNGYGRNAVTKVIGGQPYKVWTNKGQLYATPIIDESQMHEAKADEQSKLWRQHSDLSDRIDQANGAAYDRLSAKLHQLEQYAKEKYGPEFLRDMVAHSEGHLDMLIVPGSSDEEMRQLRQTHGISDKNFIYSESTNGVTEADSMVDKIATWAARKITGDKTTPMLPSEIAARKAEKDAERADDAKFKQSLARRSKKGSEVTEAPDAVAKGMEVWWKGRMIGRTTGEVGHSGKIYFTPDHSEFYHYSDQSPELRTMAVDPTEVDLRKPMFATPTTESVDGTDERESSSARVSESKHGLSKRVKIVAGPEKGKTGTVGEVRHGQYKGAPKEFTIDLDGGGNVRCTAKQLRLIKQVAEAGKKGTSKHAKEMAAQSKKYYDDAVTRREREQGETYQIGNAKVTKPPVKNESIEWPFAKGDK